MVNKNKKIEELLSRGVGEVVEKKHLEKRLRGGEKLRVKFGIDPTAPDLHLGHSVPLLKLKQFQELGHQIIFLIGDFTARIGDPTGRVALRTPLSPAEIKENMKNYKEQASKILDIKKVEVRYNTEWWSKMSLAELMVLAAKVTYSQISQRADFKKRLAEEKDFTLQEFIYPVLQGYDSVALKADLEIGGTDQKFNMLMGRRIQKRYKQSVQDVMTLKLLVGTDGAKKMSKTFRNFIGITESAQNQYGKIMSIPDHLIKDYFELCTRVSLGEMKAFSPRGTKAKLAREIVKTYYGQKVALKAEREFNRVFKEKKMPSKIPEFKIREKSLNILDLLTKTKLAPSKSEAKRLVEQGGVKIDNEAQKDWRPEVKIKKGQILQAGKRKFVKIV